MTTEIASKGVGRKPFYITTTIPYVNSAPHIGFALEITQADTIARHKRLMGYEVFFNFGVDEHGQKILQKANELKQTPQEYVDIYAAKFDALKKKLNLTYDNFIRTTDEHHEKAAQEMWLRCKKRGDIYKKNYKVKYCVGCELEKTDSELVHGECPLHPGKELEIREEENYFFKLSAYQGKLSKLYASGDLVIPDYRLNEIRSLFTKSGLQDFSISRLKTKMPWGVSVPDDPAHVMYVWFDALVNYISTLGWPDNLCIGQNCEENLFKKFWNGTKDCIQMAGKDQVRQQAVMWQAMLMSAELPRTGQIFIHGFINSGGQKMSKSLGNVIDPIEIVDEYGVDALRYFLLRHIHPTEDSDFTIERFREAYNANLANGLGNLTARVMKMSEDNLDVPIEYPDALKFAEEEYTEALKNFEFNVATDYIWKRIQTLDQKITETEPFRLVKTDKLAAQELIAELVIELYAIGRLLNPMMPDTSKKIKAAVLANKKPETLFERK